MGFRIDPIDERGVFDHDFYTSEQYSKEVEILKMYLENEGFDVKKEPFSITIKNRTWYIKPTTSKK